MSISIDKKIQEHNEEQMFKAIFRNWIQETFCQEFNSFFQSWGTLRECENLYEFDALLYYYFDSLLQAETLLQILSEWITDARLINNPSKVYSSFTKNPYLFDRKPFSRQTLIIFQVQRALNYDDVDSKIC